MQKSEENEKTNSDPIHPARSSRKAIDDSRAVAFTFPSSSQWRSSQRLVNHHLSSELKRYSNSFESRHIKARAESHFHRQIIFVFFPFSQLFLFVIKILRFQPTQ